MGANPLAQLSWLPNEAVDDLETEARSPETLPAGCAESLRLFQLLVPNSLHRNEVFHGKKLLRHYFILLRVWIPYFEPRSGALSRRPQGLTVATKSHAVPIEKRIERLRPGVTFESLYAEKALIHDGGDQCRIKKVINKGE